MNSPETVIVGIRELRMFTTMIIPCNLHRLELAWTGNFETNMFWQPHVKEASKDSLIIKKFIFERSSNSIEIMGQHFAFFGFMGIE